MFIKPVQIACDSDQVVITALGQVPGGETTHQRDSKWGVPRMGRLSILNSHKTTYPLGIVFSNPTEQCVSVKD